MTYYYLVPDKDIIQEGDEYNLNSRGYWCPCKTSIGRTIQEHSDKASWLTDCIWKVRRPTTKLGNRL